jgi:hypothetical protein
VSKYDKFENLPLLSDEKNKLPGGSCNDIEAFRSLRYGSRRPSFLFKSNMRSMFEINAGINVDEISSHDFPSMQQKQSSEENGSLQTA